jgi:hypothetical protein
LAAVFALVAVVSFLATAAVITTAGFRFDTTWCSTTACTTVSTPTAVVTAPVARTSTTLIVGGGQCDHLKHVDFSRDSSGDHERRGAYQLDVPACHVNFDRLGYVSERVKRVSADSGRHRVEQKEVCAQSEESKGKR